MSRELTRLDGVEFDPDKLLARWENGDRIEELVQQGSA